MKKTGLIIYRVATILLTLLMSVSISMYIFQHHVAVEAFTKLGVPLFIIYPLAIAKLLGLIAIWTNKSKMLKEWAYAGFTFNLLLAVGVHLNVGDGEFGAAAVGLIFLGLSYFYHRKLYTTYAE